MHCVAVRFALLTVRCEGPEVETLILRACAQNLIFHAPPNVECFKSSSILFFSKKSSPTTLQPVFIVDDSDTVSMHSEPEEST